MTRETYESLDKAIENIETYRLHEIKDKPLAEINLYELGKQVLEWDNNRKLTIIDDKTKGTQNE